MKKNHFSFVINYCLSLIMFCTCSLEAWAVKADPTPANILQSDGTRLTVIGHGNSDNHWYTTLDGVFLVHQGTDFFVAELTPDGRLTSTAQLAHEAGQRTNEERLIIEKQRKQLAPMRRSTFAPRPSSDKPRHEPIRDKSTYIPHVGSPRVPVILAQFQDVKFIDEDPVPVFQQFLNAPGKIDTEVGNGTVAQNYGSVARYFTEMSFGAFTPEFDVYGPVTLSKELGYYGEGSYDNMRAFVPEVCQLADNDIDFSLYDANNDDLVDLIYIIYAGYSESITGNSTECIWPKSSTMPGIVVDGKSIYRFGAHSERNGYPGDDWEEKNGMARIGGIGLFCHEFSHCMGLPDIYPTHSRAQDVGNPSMEYWDLMDGGEYTQNGYYPTEYTAWEREACGWMKLDTLTASGEYSLLPLGTEGAKAYRIMNDEDATCHEYLFLQNIQAVGFNKRLAQVLGHGMLVTHVDYDAIAFTLESNSVNNSVGHSRMTFVPADDEYISYYLVGDTYSQNEYILSHRGDPFPGTTNRTELTSFPFYTGECSKSLTEISEDEATGVINFTYTDPHSGIRQYDIVQPSSPNSQYIYDLSGRKVGTLQNQPVRRGIYIVGGKKVVY